MARTAAALALAACLTLPVVHAGTPMTVNASDSQYVAWIGRHRVNNDGSVQADWSGVEALLWLANGTTSLTMTLEGNNAGGQRYAVYVKGTATGYRWVRTSAVWTDFNTVTVNVLSGYSDQYDVQVRIQRTIEPVFSSAWTGSNTRFLNFTSNSGFVPVAPARSPRRMEFYGDSITACLGNLGDFYAGCWAGPLTQDLSFGYAKLLAEMFDAESSVLAWSGISLALHRTGPSFPWCEKDGCVLPDLVNYSLPTNGPEADGGNDWDFSQWVPQYININLGTNDQGGNFSNASFVAEYEAAYVSFVHQLDEKYAHAPIIYGLGFGPMSSAYNSSVQNVVATLVSQGFNALALDFNVPSYSPVGCEWHPSTSVHAIMAAKVAPLISKATGWQPIQPKAAGPSEAEVQAAMRTGVAPPALRLPAGSPYA